MVFLTPDLSFACPKVSLSLRLKDLLGPVTRVKKKKKKPQGGKPPPLQQFPGLCGLSPGSQGQCLAVTVLYVPYLLGSGN